jgi:hypothetical protein
MAIVQATFLESFIICNANFFELFFKIGWELGWIWVWVRVWGVGGLTRVKPGNCIVKQTLVLIG